MPHSEDCCQWAGGMISFLWIWSKRRESPPKPHVLWDMRDILQGQCRCLRIKEETQVCRARVFWQSFSVSCCHQVWLPMPRCRDLLDYDPILCLWVRPWSMAWSMSMACPECPPLQWLRSRSLGHFWPLLSTCSLPLPTYLCKEPHTSSIPTFRLLQTLFLLENLSSTLLITMCWKPVKSFPPPQSFLWLLRYMMISLFSKFHLKFILYFIL